MTRTREEAYAHLAALYATHFGEGAEGGVDGDWVFASAPGRIELAGNHTDHQGGRTISAATGLRTYALAAANNSSEIRVFMEDFGTACVDTRSQEDLKPRLAERGSSLALVRGMAAAWARRGKALRGMNMVVCSDIPVGRGLSSSAAFEVLVGAVIQALCAPWASCSPAPSAPCSTESCVPSMSSASSMSCKSPAPALCSLVPSMSCAPSMSSAPASPQELTALALDGVWAEQQYFGKPCGAQDQLASAFGGVALMDFFGATPLVTPLSLECCTARYALYLIDSRCDHSRYTNEFAAIFADMYAVAQAFDCARLAEVPSRAFFERLGQLRRQLGDRPVLRALHYFEEAQRVNAQAQALQTGNVEAFLRLVCLSGASSAQFLQNVSPCEDGLEANQDAMVILALCAHLLESSCPSGCGQGGSTFGCEQGVGADSRSCANVGSAGEVRVGEGGVGGADRGSVESADRGGAEGRGAYRIHGGGFGGSVLAFVPHQNARQFEAALDDTLGYRACTPISIDPCGVEVQRLR